MEKPDLIKYIEKQTGVVLKELTLPEEGIFDSPNGYWVRRGYALDEKGEIIALALDGVPASYFSIEPLVGQLRNLERLSCSSHDLV